MKRMNNKVLLLLLGILFFGMNVGAQTVSVTDNSKYIVYTYDKSKVTTSSEGTVTSNTAIPQTISGLVVDEFGTTVTVEIGGSNVDGSANTYGKVITGAVKKVAVTPSALQQGTKVELRTFEASEGYSATELISSYDQTRQLTWDEEEIAEMNKVVEQIYAVPTSATLTNYVYSGARLKSVLGSSFSTALDYDGNALDEEVCYIYKKKAVGVRKYADRYVPVSVLTINAYKYQNTVTGSLVCEPTSIPSSFIAGNTSITSVTIPASITSIGVGAFAGCTSLNYFDNASSSFSTESYFTTANVLYNAAKTEIIAAPANMTGEYSLAENVTTIRDYAFNNNENLTVYHYGATYNKSTHGSSVIFQNKATTWTETPVYASDGTTMVGVVFSGSTDKTSLSSCLTKYAKVSYVDMRNVFVTGTTSAKPLKLRPKTNQIYIYGSVNTDATFYVELTNTTYNKNIVYTNSDGELVCNNYVLSESSVLNKNVYIPYSFRAEQVTINRAISSGIYASLIVPVNFDETPNDLTVYNFINYIESTKKYRVKVGEIAANVPCLVKSSSAVTAIVGSGEVVATTSLDYSTDKFNGMKVTGVYNQRAGSELDTDNDADGRDYFFTSSAGIAQFTASNVGISPFRAFIHLPASFLSSSSSAKGGVFELSDDDLDTTDIESASLSNTVIEEYYTTDGVKIESLQKGINIVRTVDADGTVHTTKKIIK